MRVEILIASLKAGYREEDLRQVLRWNTDYHESRGVRGVRDYVSDDRSTFVMTVPRRAAVGDKLAKEWVDSGAERQPSFRQRMEKVFTGGASRLYDEVRP